MKIQSTDRTGSPHPRVLAARNAKPLHRHEGCDSEILGVQAILALQAKEGIREPLARAVYFWRHMDCVAREMTFHAFRVHFGRCVCEGCLCRAAAARPSCSRSSSTSAGTTSPTAPTAAAGSSRS